MASEPCFVCEAHAEMHGWWDPERCFVCEEHAEMHAAEEGCAGWLFVIGLVTTTVAATFLKRR